MKRIYVVAHVKTGEEQLVRGQSRAGARSTATKNDYAVKLATQDDLVRLVAAGKKVLEEVVEEQLPMSEA